MGVLLIAGAVLWYRPALTSESQRAAEVPAPPALFAATRFALPGHRTACESAVTVTPQSQVASFALYPAAGAKHGGPPVELTLDAAGYHGRVHLVGGYPGGSAALPLSPPAQPVIATACFHNLGSGAVSLVGTDEARTVSRSNPVVIAGRALPGDIALSFYESRPEDVLQSLGTAARHASNVGGGLLPPLLIFVIAAIVALGIPAAMILALRTALREDSRWP